MNQIVALRHRRRVIEREIESLRGYIDIDIRMRQQLEAEGCLVPYVPQEVIMTEIRFNADRIGVLDREITSLEERGIGRALPAPTAVAEPARPRRRRAGG